MKKTEKLCRIISQTQENLKSAKFLLENKNNIEHYVIKEFGDNLILKIKDNIKVTDKHSFNLNNNVFDLKFNIKGLEFFIYNENQIDECLYWGFYDEKINENIVKSNIFKKGNNYFMKFFVFETKTVVINNKEYQIEDRYLYLQNFTKNSTFNLLDADYRNFVIEKIIEEINETLSLDA